MPVRIRPRIETSPVNGHFLSTNNALDLLQDSYMLLEQFIPMYVPSIAVFGVLNPKPTSLYHLRPPFPTLVLLVRLDFWLTKI